MNTEQIITEGVCKNYYTQKEINALGISVYEGTISAALGIVGKVVAKILERKETYNQRSQTYGGVPTIKYDEDRNAFYSKSDVDSLVVYFIQEGSIFDIDSKTWSK